MITLTDVCAGYPGKEILHHITAFFPPARLSVIVGPNGCGKTTLLRTISTGLPLMHGSITVADRPLSDYDPAALARTVAVLPQSREAPDAIVSRLVLYGRFPRLRYPRHYRREDYDIAAAAMERAGVTALGDRPLRSLSGGERQRVYLAMVLAQDTPVILLDEPTTFLDIRAQLDLLALLGTLRDEGKTIIAVLHDLESALRTADAVLVMRDGCAAAFDTPEKLAQTHTFDDIFHVRTALYTADDGDKRYFFRN
ncbi:MAG: ABC transporter ATP-binding protein [Clostridiaceae bacterium]|nr:ABC transporter ATP-binding protein [Clostridiaceae bacterium]